MPTRAPRQRRRERLPRIPTSMVRAGAFFPIPPWSEPAGTQSIGIACSAPMMPTGITGIKVIILAGDGGPGLADPISVSLRDPSTIQVVCEGTLDALGVYIPYNDPGFRGVTGGMLNPGELSATAGPRDFPWVCGLG